jgi:ubiquinone biosynthesis protein Coq4
MQCTKCGKESNIVVTILCNGVKEYLCGHCFVTGQKTTEEIDELDKAIEDFQNLTPMLERLTEHEDGNQLSEAKQELAQFALPLQKLLRLPNKT